MNDLRLFLLYDPADDAWAQQLIDKLGDAFRNHVSSAEDVPIIERRTIADVPTVAELGPLSLVMVVLPARAFSSAEQQALRRFVDLSVGGDPRLLPVSSEPARDVPQSPLDALVSSKVHALADAVAIERAAVCALNLLSLRVAGRSRSLFVSYRTVDGKAIAEQVEQGLRARGYEVWRDELADRDGLPLIGPGSPAQRTIEAAILRHGFVLVIDSPLAHKSTWVNEEVAQAIRWMLPMLPVVVEDVVGPRQPLIGGRFLSLQAMQREVRVGGAALTPANVAAVLDDAFFDTLELQVNAVLLDHLRTRRRLLREAEQQFNSLSFDWTTIDEQHLLYCADLDRDSDLTPNLHLRLLVQCAPYNVVLDDAVGNFHALFPRQAHYCQFGILIHQAAIYGAHRRNLLRGRGHHLLLLRSDEVDQLPRLLRLDAPAVAP